MRMKKYKWSYSGNATKKTKHSPPEAPKEEEMMTKQTPCMKPQTPQKTATEEPP